MLNMIPLLEPINDITIIKNIFPELLFDDIDESIEKMSLKYNNALLSNFEKILDKNDKRINLLSNNYYSKLQEDKYIDFMIKIFEQNSNNCIINTNLLSLKYDVFFEYLNYGIDIKFQYLLLHQYIQLFNNQNKYFCIKDKELLKLFIIFSLRENMLTNFFLFPKNKVCLISNYDCLFPLFYKDKVLFNEYSKIAKNTGLFFINKNCT